MNYSLVNWPEINDFADGTRPFAGNVLLFAGDALFAPGETFDDRPSRTPL